MMDFHHSLDAIHAARHLQIDKADGVVHRLRERERVLAIGGGVDVIAVFPQPRSHRFAHHFFIVDDQDRPILLHNDSSREANFSTSCIPQRVQYRSAFASTNPMWVARLMAHFESEQCTRPKVCPNSCNTSLTVRSRRMSSCAGSP